MIVTKYPVPSKLRHCQLFVINYEDSIRRRYQMEYEAAMRDSVGRLMILTIGLSAYYSTFCREFQELSWMDGKRTPLDGKRLVVHHRVLFDANYGRTTN